MSRWRVWKALWKLCSWAGVQVGDLGLRALVVLVMVMVWVGWVPGMLYGVVRMNRLLVYKHLGPSLIPSSALMVQHASYWCPKKYVEGSPRFRLLL
jgi:hypothetical protein